VVNLWAKVKFQRVKSYPASAVAYSEPPEADVLV
jgi:hypothetical protein